MGTGLLFPGVKRPGREVDHSPQSSAEVKNSRNYATTHQYILMAWCLVKHGDSFAFTSLSVHNQSESTEDGYIIHIHPNL